jgi:hypothetical protein
MFFHDSPETLAGVEFSRIHFLLEFQEPFRVNSAIILSLRRDLLRAARHALGVDRGGRGAEAFAALFDPPLFSDPVLVRRHQRPGPGFVLHPSPGELRAYDCGDTLRLPVVLLGSAVQQLGDLAATLQKLGRMGLGRGEGLFDLVAIEAEDPSGDLRCLWQEGSDLGQMAPPLIDIPWWLARRDFSGQEVSLEFLTPARLLSGGKPLFRPNFTQIFPFVLRRVTSMIAAHCHCEIVGDPDPLLRAARSLEEIDNTLEWRDYKLLERADRDQEIGGVVGSLRLAGEALDSILWVLHLGSLFNVGKNSAYGAGHYRLAAP